MKKILTCAAIVLMTLSALGLKANAAVDYFYGSTTTSSIALIDIDASTDVANVLNNYELINPQNNTALNTPLRIASNGTTVYGLSQTGGALYSLDLSHTVMASNGRLGYDATQISSGIGVSSVYGLAFISPTLLDVSTGSSLYEYNINMTMNPASLLYNFADSTKIAGIAETSSPSPLLLGMQYSPSPTGVDQIGTGGSITAAGQLSGVTPNSFLASGQSGTWYVSPGGNNLYTYNLTSHIFSPVIMLNPHGLLSSPTVVNSVVVVPEPGPLTMLGLGVLTFAGWSTLRRRRLVRSVS